MFMCHDCVSKDANKCEEANDANAAGVVSAAHFQSVESLMKNICNEKQQFERLELSKNELLEMFSYNQFKVRILKEKVKEERTTVYRCGTLIDLCRGPHVRHTGHVKAFKVTKVSEDAFLFHVISFIHHLVTYLGHALLISFPFSTTLLHIAPEKNSSIHEFKCVYR